MADSSWSPLGCASCLAIIYNLLYSSLQIVALILASVLGGGPLVVFFCLAYYFDPQLPGVYADLAKGPFMY
jgi:hypothetical protein